MRTLIERVLCCFGFERVVPAPAKPTIEDAAFHFGVHMAQVQHRHELELQDARRDAFYAGRAEGELAGRMSLHQELMVQYGADGGEHNMTTEDLRRVGFRQLH